MRFGLTTAVLAALCIACVAPAIADAAPPANDSRSAATVLTLPARVAGTVRDATTDEFELNQSCASSAGSVYYRFTATSDGQVVAQVRAAGDLDVVVAVFELTRSQAQQRDCDVTDSTGQAAATFAVKAGSTYFVKVARLFSSVPGDFTLEVFPRTSPAKLPGPRLPRAGISGTVDRVFDPDDAYSVPMRIGVPYRIVLAAPDTCVAYEVYGPGTASSDVGETDALASRGCGNSLLFTPSPETGTGLYSIRVFPGTRRLAQLRYHLQVAPAGRDDVSPGIFLRNYQLVRGAIDSFHVDSLDLYRFDVTRRSDLALNLTGNAVGTVSLQLTDDHGRLIAFARDASDEPINVRVRRGRYFVAVKALQPARMRYRLQRISRTITRTRASFGGKGHLEIGPGRLTHVNVGVSPNAVGRARVTFFRFDPISRFRFYRRITVTVRNGRASVPFNPPAVGRYSARVEFLGSRNFSPSTSNYTTLLVASPLRQ